MKPDDLKLLNELARRFETDYFIRAAGDSLFVVPNFVVSVSEGKLIIQLLEHVTSEDLTAIQNHLKDLPFEIASSRFTLTEIEQKTGLNFSNAEDAEDEV